MKNKSLPLPLTTLAFLLLFVACHSDRFPELVSINIDRPLAGIPLGEALDLTGLLVLQTNDMQGVDRVRGIDKILFSNNSIIALDNDTDFENVWIFDTNSGRHVGKFDRQSADNGIQDIAPLDNGNFCCLASDKRAFVEYNPDGKPRTTLANGVIGDMLLCLPDNQYLVYNEYSATEVSGYYQLLFFNNKGDLTNRLYPYNKNIDNIGYALSGFVSQSENRIWFSPPFCDTVYEVVKQRLVPRYAFDFGSARVPDEFRTRKLSGWDVDGNAYLCERFIKMGSFILFQYYANSRTNNCVFDEGTQQYFRFRDAAQDCLYPLLTGGNVFRKDDDTFAFLIMPPRIGYLLNNNLLDMEAILREYPGLHAALRAEASNPNPLLLYFSFKPGARIEAPAPAKE